VKWIFVHGCACCSSSRYTLVAAAAVNTNAAMMIVILIVLVLGNDVRILSVLRRVWHNDTNQTYIIASKR